MYVKGDGKCWLSNREKSSWNILPKESFSFHLPIPRSFLSIYLPLLSPKLQCPWSVSSNEKRGRRGCFISIDAITFQSFNNTSVLNVEYFPKTKFTRSDTGSPVLVSPQAVVTKKTPRLASSLGPIWDKGHSSSNRDRCIMHILLTVDKFHLNRCPIGPMLFNLSTYMCTKKLWSSQSDSQVDLYFPQSKDGCW